MTATSWVAKIVAALRRLPAKCFSLVRGVRRVELLSWAPVEVEQRYGEWIAPVKGAAGVEARTEALKFVQGPERSRRLVFPLAECLSWFDRFPAREAHWLHCLQADHSAGAVWVMRRNGINKTERASPEVVILGIWLTEQLCTRNR